MKRFIKLVLALLVFPTLLGAQTITVNWASPQQTIDGFGASAADFLSPLPSNLANFFYSDSTGIGLSILRLDIEPSLSECQSFAVANGYPASVCITVGSGATTYAGEPSVAQVAVANGAAVVATSWSPPGSMKSNGYWDAAGSYIGGSSNNTSYASILASFPGFMAGYGVPIYAISPQNEPDISMSYPSCTWTAAQFDSFIPVLSSALSTAGYGSVKIMFPENSSWSTTYDGFTATTMGDSGAAPDVGILAQHGYGVTSPAQANTYSGYSPHVWMTEDGDDTSPNYTGTMADALAWAQTIHNYLATAQVNAWIWWYLSDLPCCGNGTDNSALTDSNGNIPMRAYVTGNWSKFVRPGWHRVGVTNSGGLLVTAFQSPDNLLSAIVVVNSSGSSVSNQAFSVGTALGAAVTPWLTSSTQNLVAQSPVAVSSGTLTYTIPADSVVTFYGSNVTGGSGINGALAGVRN